MPSFFKNFASVPNPTASNTAVFHMLRTSSIKLDSFAEDLTLAAAATCRGGSTSMEAREDSGEVAFSLFDTRSFLSFLFVVSFF